MEPLSNLEVYKVLKARETHTKISQEFANYLELIEPKEDEYSMESLRKVKDIPQETLCVLANTQDISIIDSATDQRKINKVKNG